MTRVRAALACSLLALTGVALADVLVLAEWRRDLQQLADGVGFHAMRARAASADPQAQGNRAIRHWPAQPYRTSHTIQYPPLKGRFAGSPDAIHVTARAVRSPFFSSLLGWSYPLHAESTAAVLRAPADCPGVRVMRVE